MQKKYIYTAVTIAVLVLGYFNYYVEEKPIEPMGANIVETSDVVYQSGEYKIEAGKQLDDLDNDKTSFEMAKALFGQMSISGENAIIDNLKNLVLENNILGISNNGWKFNTEKARYSNESEKIYSEDGVTAYNEEKKISIYGKNFETDTTMKNVVLSNDINVESEKFKLTADKAVYSDETKVVDITGNIDVTVEDASEETKGQATGRFTVVKYDTEKKILEAFEPFVMNYKGIDLHGERLLYDENTGDFKVWQNVKAVKEESTMDMDRIEYKASENMMTFHGNLTGTNPEYTLTADNGYYNTLDKVVTLDGNVDVKALDGRKIIADKAVFNTITNDLTVSAIKNVIVTTRDGKVVTKKANYNTESEELRVEQNYTMITPEYVSKGSSLYYNGKTEKGTTIKGDIKGKDFYGKGDKVEFDTLNKKHDLIGNAMFTNSDYTLTGDKIEYDEATTLATIIGKYTVTSSDKTEKFYGNNASYNTKTSQLISPNNFNGNNSEYKFSGNHLKYNSVTGAGSIGSNVKIINKKDGTTITGNSANFKRDDFAKLVGNIKLKTPKYTATGKEADYRLKEEKVYIPGLIKISGKDSVNGTMYDGVFDVAKNIYTGDRFKGSKGVTKASGDKVEYLINNEIIKLNGNVVLEDSETKLVGSLAEYHAQNGDVYADEPFKIYYDNLTIDSTRGKFNLVKKSIDGENVVIKTAEGERLSGNQIYGSFVDKKIDIVGNVKALGYNVDAKGNKQPINYNGDTARVYFVDEDGYKATRSEVRNNGIFKYQDMTLYSDYMEIDLLRNLALGREGSKIIMKSGTTIVSEVSDMNLNTEVVNLINNIEIVSGDKVKGYTKAMADRGIIRNKEQIAELEGNVFVENADATIEADRGIYNMSTKKLDAKGNVFVNYKVK